MDRILKVSSAILQYVLHAKFKKISISLTFYFFSGTLREFEYCLIKYRTSSIICRYFKIGGTWRHIFAVDLEFSVEIELFSTENCSIMICLTEIPKNVALRQSFYMPEDILGKLAWNCFIQKIQKFSFFSLNPA